ncbi:MAG: hypothetical protein RLZZ196_1191 [Bacteroidota bacterium]|jgi:hypothetical protein
MNQASKSPDRNTFQKEGFLKRQAEKGLTPDNDENTRQMLEWYESWDAEDDKWAAQEQKNDLEYDLRTCDWILAKARASNAYAQNIYAALCNMRWCKRELWPLLSENYWSCSWRSAGGIVANMRQEGDYIDWYCSGMGGLNQEYDSKETNEEWQKRTGYVPEGVITDEIETDFNQLGWIPVPWKD